MCGVLIRDNLFSPLTNFFWPLKNRSKKESYSMGALRFLAFVLLALVCDWAVWSEEGDCVVSFYWTTLDVFLVYLSFPL